MVRNCLISLSLIINKSRAKPQVILSEMYCIYFLFSFDCLSHSIFKSVGSVVQRFAVSKALTCKIANQIDTTLINFFNILKQICLFYKETPSHGPIPPIVRMARWPKMPGELERYIGAESVPTIRLEKAFVLVV